MKIGDLQNTLKIFGEREAFGFPAKNQSETLSVINF
jgi:hypothetical protein